jgi:transposase-like protein
MLLIVVCTDACKGLEEVVKFVFPMAKQRECFKHLMNNYVKKYKGAEHMYLVGRAYRKDVYDYHMNHVYAIPETKWYLDTYHSLKWYRGGFNPAIKCDYVTNNIAEVFNNWIKDIKDLPLFELADKVRKKIIVLWHKRKKVGEMLDGRILPTVLHVLKVQTRGLDHLNVVKGDHYAAQVVDISTSNSRQVVKAYLHECSCEEW